MRINVKFGPDGTPFGSPAMALATVPTQCSCALPPRRSGCFVALAQGMSC